MQKPGGRESDSPKGQGVPYQEVPEKLSPSTFDKTNTEILSLTSGNPMTILTISEKLSLPFIECLLRTGELWRMSLLDRIEAEPDSVGLYRYFAITGHD